MWIFHNIFLITSVGLYSPHCRAAGFADQTSSSGSQAKRGSFHIPLWTDQRKIPVVEYTASRSQRSLRGIVIFILVVATVRGNSSSLVLEDCPGMPQTTSCEQFYWCARIPTLYTVCLPPPGVHLPYQYLWHSCSTGLINIISIIPKGDILQIFQISHVLQRTVMTQSRRINTTLQGKVVKCAGLWVPWEYKEFLTLLKTGVKKNMPQIKSVYLSP